MTEDVKTEQTEQTTTTEATEPTFTEVEQRAMAQGWQPQDKWVEAGHDEAEWRDARSFLDRGELLNRISSQSKEMKELRKALNAFQEHNKKLAEARYAETMASLKEQKKEALEGGDAQRVVELDEQIDVVRDHIASSKAAQVATEVQPSGELHPDFQRWVERNSWYAQNAEMRETADAVGTSYAKTNPGKSPTEVLAYVEQRIRKTYSEQFQNTKREMPSTVESGGGQRRSGTGPRKDDIESQLDETSRKVMNDLVRGGHIKKEDYLKQWASINKQGR